MASLVARRRKQADRRVGWMEGMDGGEVGLWGFVGEGCGSWLDDWDVQGRGGVGSWLLARGGFSSERFFFPFYFDLF